MTQHHTQDSQSELNKLIESWIPISVKDKDFVKEAKMKGRKDFKEAIEAYVTTRVKESERLARIDELKQAMIAIGISGDQNAERLVSVEHIFTSLVKRKKELKALTTTTNGKDSDENL